MASIDPERFTYFPWMHRADQGSKQVVAKPVRVGGPMYVELDIREIALGAQVGTLRTEYGTQIRSQGLSKIAHHDESKRLRDDIRAAQSEIAVAKAFDKEAWCLAEKSNPGSAKPDVGNGIEVRCTEQRLYFNPKGDPAKGYHRVGNNPARAFILTEQNPNCPDLFKIKGWAFGHEIVKHGKLFEPDPKNKLHLAFYALDHRYLHAPELLVDRIRRPEKPLLWLDMGGSKAQSDFELESEDESCNLPLNKQLF